MDEAPGSLDAAAAGDAGGVTSGDPAEVVRAFLTALASADPAAAVGLVADDLVYENVSLPTIRGKARFARGAEHYYRRGLRFDVRIHRIATDGDVVLTERTDAIMIGGFRSQFWVCGTFEVHDGRISLWRDYFDWKDVTVASLRGLAGLAAPSIRATFAS
jgi:limonene-1,2-epoxide hydrolase